MDAFPSEMICLFLQPNTDLLKANGVAGLQPNPVRVTLVLAPVVECSLVGTDLVFFACTCTVFP